MTEIVHGHRLSEEKWHSMEVDAVCDELQCSLEGLSDAEAAERLRRYGPNTLPTAEPPTIWAILLHQVLNPLIFILLVAAVASVAIGKAMDAIFILAVIVLNSALGAYQEFNAERSAASLRSLLKIMARVRRGNGEREIPSEEVVPGDLVLVESGRKVPADLRLSRAQNLTADESFLTGESIAAEKGTELLAEDTGVSDRRNMLFAGATVTSGRGLGIAVGTAGETQVGIIAETVTRSESAKPPLVLRMERFIKHISFLVLAVSAGLAMLLWYRGENAASIFLFVVALAVAAIPEGLPVALTMALSIATKRMSARNVIVRRLTAVESLGSCTVIASDKTGTLTVNQQTARRVMLADGQTLVVTGQGYNGEGEVTSENGAELTQPARDRLKRMSELAVLANEASLIRENGDWRHHGDAMDVAFLALGFKLGLSPAEVQVRTTITGHVPYESERKFSAVFYEAEGVRHVAAKGAVETILDFCDRMMWRDDPVELDGERIEQQAEAMAKEGLRVLAVAGGETDVTVTADDQAPAALSGLVLYGLVGFIDPLRPEAVEAVKTCRAAGIRVIMITGDHPATAGAIARDLTLTDEEEPVVSGHDLRRAGTPDSPAFEKRVLSTHVFARATPMQKLEIVDVLIRRGEFVAVTGDGVNDAPALRRANIGVAMGSGSDVAKEVGSMIVVDDNFASIVAGVEEGRFAYDNVRKVIYLLISTGAATVMMVVSAVLVGLPLPFMAVQLLWLNVVTNGIQDVALAFEGGEPGAMKRKPRNPSERIIDRHMISQTLVSGATMAVVAFTAWYWLIRVHLMEESAARNLLLLLMVLMLNVHVFNCRSEWISTFEIPLSRNYILILGMLAAQGIHVWSLYLPFMRPVLGTQPVTARQWLLCLSLALVLLVVMETFKWFRRRQA